MKVKNTVIILVFAVLVGGAYLLNSDSVQEGANNFLAREKSSVINANSGSVTGIGRIEDLPELECRNISGEKSETFSCYEKFYQQVVSEDGPQQAMLDLKTRYNSEPYVKAECHQLAHVVGRAATAKYPTVDEAYIRGDSACWSGYYHGVIESVMVSIGSSNVDFKTLDGICKSLAERERYSFNHYNCVHGIGHGAMYITDNELFESLEMCDKLENMWDQSSCWGGVFMENVIADNKNHFAKYLKPEDPIYPCNAIRDDQKTTCYLMQTSYMLKVKGGDFGAVFDLCSSVESAYRDTCFQSLGRDASGWTISDVDRTRNYCMMGKDSRAQSNCIIGAVKDFISYHHSDVQAKVFCNSLKDEYKNTCLTTTESYYSTF